MSPPRPLPTPSLLLTLPLLAACALAQRDGDTVQVRFVDAGGIPVAGAVAWTCPVGVFADRVWVPPELWRWWDNRHELLRRTGTRCTADDDGVVALPRGTILAAEAGERSAVATIAADTPARCDVVLDDRSWTIAVRDDAGKPQAGVPIECRSQRGDAEAPSLLLGTTDAHGMLVVRAPQTLLLSQLDWYDEFLTEEVELVDSEGKTSTPPPPPPAPKPPLPPRECVHLQVHGWMLRDHAVAVRLADPHPPTLVVQMPPTTHIEVHVPDWNGPIAEMVTLSPDRARSGFPQVLCWRTADAFEALVGATPEGTQAYVEIPGSDIGSYVTVPAVPPGQKFAIDLALAEGDIVVRARVHDPSGRPLGHAYLTRVLPTQPELRTNFVVTDDKGRFALVLRPGLAAGTELRFRIAGCRDGRWRDAEITVRLDDLHAGDRRDLGIVSPKKP